MGAALFIALEKDIEGFDPFVNGKALSTHHALLDRMAKELGVTPLMDFFSVDPAEALGFVQAEFEAEGKAMPELTPPPPEKWFSPDHGLRTVRALKQSLSSARKKPRGWKSVLKDLEEFEGVLERARKENVRWHLEVDF